MTPKALEWQKKIRKFVNDELIPWEVHAEKNDGSTEYQAFADASKRITNQEMFNWIKIQAHN